MGLLRPESDKRNTCFKIYIIDSSATDEFEKAFAAADGYNEGIVKHEDTQFQIIMNMRTSMRLVL